MLIYDSKEGENQQLDVTHISSQCFAITGRDAGRVISAIRIYFPVLYFHTLVPAFAYLPLD
ncbi:hypothetical protein CPB83DRAFT_853155 [Crepidotus variabilis]|uniref:Uncharacterized protein n=1 Tax=Crepidotus variabilis TaxID=179855 RepID=A0A9P6EHI2_9AGAR|nr:hypothetical protein CPB83DRAFT_853155 [Crepidotus variabilis]